MKNTPKTLAILTALIAVTSPAMAQNQDSNDDSGIYVSVSGGAEFFNDSDFIGIQDPGPGVPGVAGAPANVEVDYDTGFSLRGAIGYEFKKGIVSFLKPRVELEAGYSEADVSSGSFNGGSQIFSGGLDVFTAQASLYSDIIWKDNQKIVPYFGSGIGIGVVDANVSYFPNNGIATEPTFGVFNSSTDLTTHSSLGLTFKLNERFNLFTEARYTKIYRDDFERTFVAGGASGFSADLSDDTETFGIGLGVRAKF